MRAEIARDCYLCAEIAISAQR